MKLQRLLLVCVSFLLVGSGLIPQNAYAAEDIAVNDQVTDTHSFLTDSEVRSLRESTRKAAENGYAIYYVATPQLTSPSLTTWCEQTAQKSNLPKHAVMFAVGYENRKFVACHGPAFPSTDAQITKATGAATAQMQANPLGSVDLTQAFTAFAIALTDVTEVSTETSMLRSSQVTDFLPDFDLFTLLSSAISFIIPLIMFIGVVSWWSRQKRQQFKQQSQGRYGQQNPVSSAEKPLETLLRETSKILMDTDNSVRSAADDLAFAQAQFGQLETQDFVQALSRAQDLISTAFITHASLVNSPDPQSQRQLASQVQLLCQQANEALASMVTRFDKLRADTANLPQTLNDLETQIAEAEQKNQLAKSELETLRVTYSDQQLQSLFDNPDNVTRLLGSARTAVSYARNTLQSGSVNAEQTALQQVQLAQRSFGQAIGQINEVMYASSDLREASLKLAAAISSLGSDLQDVSRLAAHNSAFQGMVDNAQRAISAANQALAGSGDVLVALTELRSAEDALDVALAPLRDSEVQAQRTEQRFTILNQEVSQLILRADTYINSRRGGVAQEARTSLANAEAAQSRAANQLQHYQRLGRYDEQQAEACFAQLQQAKSYAEAALEYAQQNVLEATANYGGNVFSGRQQQSGGIDLFSLILGGILSNSGYSNSSGYERNSRSESSDSGSGFNWGSGGDFFGGGFSSGGGFSTGGWSSSSSGSF